MRTLTSLLVAVTALLPAGLVRPADACGSYIPEPQVIRLSAHHTAEGSRTFALLAAVDADVTKDLHFERLAPRSYDAAAIADAPAASAMMLTLVGRSGTRTVTSAKRVFVARSFAARGATMTALEVPAGKGDFQIAVVGGRFRDLAWSDIAGSEAMTASDAAWVKEQGVATNGPIYKQRLADDLIAFSTFQATGDRLVTVLRRNTAAAGQFYGSPLGVLAASGERYVVLDDNGVTRTTAIW